MSISSEQFREMQSRAERAAFHGQTFGSGAPATKQSRNEKRESEIQGEIEAYLKSLGRCCYYVRSRMDKATTNKAGTPDFVGCCRGKMFAIEVKRPGGKATAGQIGELMRVRLAGGVSRVAFCVEDVMLILES